MSVLRTCRDCGCSQNDACISQDGEACYWAEPDLCSSCAAGAWPVYRMLADGINRQDVKGGDWTLLSRGEANALLEHFAQFSRRRFAGLG